MITEHIREDEMLWLGTDLDATIADSSGYPNYKLTEPLPGAVEALQELNRRGWKIVIFTARPSADYRMIESFLNDHKIPFKMIICGKLLCKYYIDDRNISFKGDWKQVLNEVRR